MTSKVREYITTCITHGWQALRVRLPSLSGGVECSHNVRDRNRPAERVIVSNDLPGSQFKIVANGRMGVSKILCAQPALPDQAVQVRHLRVSNYFRIAVVFFHDEKDMTGLTTTTTTTRS